VRSARLLYFGWFLQLKLMLRSAFNGVLSVVWPMFFATTAFFIYRAGHDQATLLFASLGASVMGIWSATSTSAASMLQRERRHGTLELLAATPANFALVLLPISVAMSTVGLYSMVATLLWGHFVFGIAMHLVHPLLFVIAVPVTIAAVGALGFLLAVGFVRYRQAWALGNALEYPVWLICGFLVPLSLLPGWVAPISWLLAPTFGVRAIREAALGGTPVGDVLLCGALGLAYFAIGVLLTERVLYSARKSGALSLS
jgi:ABC-2 type transport system permease protein